MNENQAPELSSQVKFQGGFAIFCLFATYVIGLVLFIFAAKNEESAFAALVVCASWVLTAMNHYVMLRTFRPLTAVAVHLSRNCLMCHCLWVGLMCKHRRNCCIVCA